MRCKRCGTEIEPLEHFCKGCGKEVVSLRADNEILYSDDELSQVELEKMNKKEDIKPVEKIEENKDIFGEALFNMENNGQEETKNSSVNYNNNVDNLNRETNINLSKEDNLMSNDSNNIVNVNDLNNLQNSQNLEENQTNKFIIYDNKDEKKDVPVEILTDEDVNMDIFDDSKFKTNDAASNDVENNISKEPEILDLDIDSLDNSKTESKEPIISSENTDSSPSIETNTIVEPTSIKESKQKKKSKLPLILIIVALILLLIAGFTSYLYAKNLPSKIFATVLDNIKTIKSETNVREEISFNVNIDVEEPDEISDLINNLALNIISHNDNNKMYVNFNPTYKGNDIINTDIYLDKTELNIYLNNIFNKYISTPLENSIDYDEFYDNFNTLITELKKEIKNSLNSKYLNFKIIKEEIASKNTWIVKSTFKIDSNNYEELKNRLKNNKVLISSLCKISEVNEEDANIFIETIFANFNKLNVNLYSELINNNILKFELEINDELKVEIVNNKGAYDFVISNNDNKIDGSMKLEEQNYKLTIKNNDSTISFNVKRKVEYDEQLLWPAMKNKILYTELTDKDTKNIEEKIANNESIIEILEIITGLFPTQN